MRRPSWTLLSTNLWAATVLVAGLLAWPAQAQQASGGLSIRGVMETICYVQVYQSINTVNIVNGASNLTIGSVGEKCNLGNGFKVSISSANAGALVDASGNRAPYTIQYDNSGIKSLATPVVLTRTLPKKAISTRSFRVNFAAAPNAIAGDYSDTITVTIAAR